MFKGLNFTVVPFSVDIGKKRKKVLEDIIKKNEGKIIKLEKINNKLIPDFIITSKNVKNIFDIFSRNQIGAIPIEERTNFLNNIFKRILNYEWISKCVLEKKIIDVDDYIIDIEELGIKKRSRSRITSQNNNKVISIEQLKQELNIFPDKNLSQPNVNINSINLLNNNNNSQNSNSKSSKNSVILSSFNSNAFDLDNSELNLDNLSDEELFNKIKEIVVNKEEDELINEEEVHKSINDSNKLEEISLSKSYSNKISNSQEIQSSTEALSSLLENNNYPRKEGINSVPKPFMSKKYQKKLNSNYFAFNMGKSGLMENKNKHLTDEFEKILEFHTNEGNKFEALAYRKVIGILKKYKEEINDVNNIPKIKGIGPKITEKIKEILITGKCLKSQNVQNDNKNKCIKELTSVHGIGIKQANEFYAQGIRSISDLKNEKIYEKLPSTIQKGLKYYEDIQIKIPREEITQLFKIIQEELYHIFDM